MVTRIESSIDVPTEVYQSALETALEDVKSGASIIEFERDRKVVAEEPTVREVRIRYYPPRGQ